ncbi:hypothetical protein ABVF47_006355 [Snodgrassella alvi]|uniref:hypothetical protein n=1 Tax=Snodgrassella alvi TaxID=1196083 RepID=UPI00352C1B90
MGTTDNIRKLKPQPEQQQHKIGNHQASINHHAAADKHSVATSSPSHSLLSRVCHYYFHPAATIRRKNRIKTIQITAKTALLLSIALIIFASVRNIIRLKNTNPGHTIFTIPPAGVRKPFPFTVQNFRALFNTLSSEKNIISSQPAPHHQQKALKQHRTDN